MNYEDILKNLGLEKFDRHPMGFGRRPTPPHSAHPARGFTKSPFNFKKAKAKRKMQTKSQRINRK